jgi:peptide-methionine (R)-S-oxide reductase
MSKVKKTDQEWREQLSEEQYRVLRGRGTEVPFSGQYVLKSEDGMYSCAACGSALFSSDDQYESTTPGLIGWPSFAEAADNSAIELREDNSIGMSRTEVVCATCGSHLGHLFDDESSPNGKHFCINSVSLDFKPKQADDKS